jgi:hypothetical protein
VADVQAAELVGAEAGVERENNESSITRTEGLARADGREQPLLLGGK